MHRRKWDSVVSLLSLRTPGRRGFSLALKLTLPHWSILNAATKATPLAGRSMGCWSSYSGERMDVEKNMVTGLGEHLRVLFEMINS